MNELIKVDVYFPEYCATCGYDCCALNCNGDCTSNTCRSFPFFFNGGLIYQRGIGLLGKTSKGYWFIQPCQGFNIKLYEETLGTILKQLVNRLNNEGKPFNHEGQGVSFKTITLGLEQLEEFNKIIETETQEDVEYWQRVAKWIKK